MSENNVGPEANMRKLIQVCDLDSSHALLACAKECTTFIAEFTTAGWFKRLINGNSNESRFDQLNAQLSNAAQTLGLGLHIFDRRQDEQDAHPLFAGCADSRSTGLTAYHYCENIPCSLSALSCWMTLTVAAPLQCYSHSLIVLCRDSGASVLLLEHLLSCQHCELRQNRPQLHHTHYSLRNGDERTRNQSTAETAPAAPAGRADVPVEQESAHHFSTRITELLWCDITKPEIAELAALLSARALHVVYTGCAPYN
jgi:hypothetical protein